jgi:hypothetical protein
LPKDIVPEQAARYRHVVLTSLPSKTIPFLQHANGRKLNVKVIDTSKENLYRVLLVFLDLGPSSNRSERKN